MKSSFFLLAAFLLIACEKDETPTKWITEDLNSEYTIQFPSNYVGLGFYQGQFFDKQNPAGDLHIGHQICNTWFEYNFCIGDTLTTPIPTAIYKLPVVLPSPDYNITDEYSNIENFFENGSELKAVLYYSEPIFDISIGYLYWNESNSFVSLARFAFKDEQFDTLKMIVNTIKKK